ncbi:MAG: DUF134 domain-containing protein [Planctomycetota bacterium]|jgi:predicted DNA-binding protein (UPF0251 family)
MARPTSTRRIARRLTGGLFKPQAIPMDRLELVTVTLDGLEALRLADLEGLYQEEAARRMGVSRATFARVLAQARRGVAEALVEGKALEFAGGEVEHRSRRAWPCPVHGGRRRGRGCRCRSGRGGPPRHAEKKE